MVNSEYKFRDSFKEFNSLDNLKKLDTNKDNKIDLKEISKLDKNNNGTISNLEFEKFRINNKEIKDEIKLKITNSNKTSIIANQFVFKLKSLDKNNLLEDLSYSKLSIKDKLSIVYDSYSDEIFNQNKERGVSNLLTNVTLTAFAAKVIPAILEKQTQKVKMIANATLLTAGLKAGYDETDRLTKDISDATYMIKNPKNKEDLEKAGKILAKSAFDMRDDLMIVLSGSVASNTKLPTVPKINIKISNALKLNMIGKIPISVVGDIPLNLKPKTKIGESKTGSTFSESIIQMAKKSKSSGKDKGSDIPTWSRKYAQSVLKKLS